MKNILKISALCFICLAIFVFGEARRSAPITLANTHSAINVTNTPASLFSGYLESVYIDVPAASTCLVTVATADETLLTATVSSDTVYRPRYTAHSSVGGVLAIATNDAVMKCLGGEYLTITATNNAVATNDVTVYITTKE